MISWKLVLSLPPLPSLEINSKRSFHPHFFASEQPRLRYSKLIQKILGDLGVMFLLLSLYVKKPTLVSWRIQEMRSRFFGDEKRKIVEIPRNPEETRMASRLRLERCELGQCLSNTLQKVGWSSLFGQQASSPPSLEPEEKTFFRRSSYEDHRRRARSSWLHVAIRWTLLMIDFV